jgi:glycogen debranching enzyme
MGRVMTKVRHYRPFCVANGDAFRSLCSAPQHSIDDPHPGYASNFGGSLKAHLLILTLLSPALVQAQDGGYGDTVMAGISNHGKNPTDPYVAAGDRGYLIGTQDGNFPDMGGHVPGEMGGLWIHPIKLIDGFQASVRDTATGQQQVLSKAAEFINYPYGNRFKYREVLDSLEVERFQFSPDGQPGVVVQYTFSNTSGRPRKLHFQLLVKTDLLPVWLSEKIGITDAPDTVIWQPATRRFLARDTRHRWFAVWGATTAAGAERVSRPPSPQSTGGMGVSAASSYTIPVAPHASSTLTFVFAGSTRSSAAAGNSFAYLARHHASLLERKRAHYASLINRARIRIPDPRLQEVYNWVRIDAEWLVREVPGIGRGISGGLMEYPWWFGTDGTYSGQALLATGNVDLVKQTLRLLRGQSAKFNRNGRIIHEVTTYGALSNPGNTQETAQFILAAGKAVQWTGDLAFAREMYPAMKQGLRWLLGDMDQNRNLFPAGYGITEILGLNAEVIDVAVYTQQALLATAEVAGVLGKKEDAARYRRLASELEQRINNRFWLEAEGSYADFYGTRAQAISTAEGAAKQIGLKGNDQLTARDRELIEEYQQLRSKFAAMPDTTRGWITNKNWVVATPMEMGIAPRARAIAVLDRIRKNDLGEYGPFLSAVERQAMMTISTGVLAVSEAKYGRTDEALRYMDKIVQTFNRKLPGSISEMMPDYGCFVIAWTMYGIVIPLVEHVFGVAPDAVTRTVVFEPHLPSGWEDISIEDLPVGNNLISLARARTNKGVEYRIDSKESGWRFVLREKTVPDARYYLNGKPVTADSAGIRMSGRKNRVVRVSGER